MQSKITQHPYVTIISRFESGCSVVQISEHWVVQAKNEKQTGSFLHKQYDPKRAGWSSEVYNFVGYRLQILTLSLMTSGQTYRDNRHAELGRSRGHPELSLSYLKHSNHCNLNGTFQGIIWFNDQIEQLLAPWQTTRPLFKFSGIFLEQCDLLKTGNLTQNMNSRPALDFHSNRLRRFVKLGCSD